MDFETAKAKMAAFEKARGWEKHHKPKDLAIKLCLESSEVLDLFEWLSEDEVKKILSDSSFKAALSEECVDVFITLIQLCDRCGINLPQEFAKSYEEDEKRFPVEKSKGLDMLQWKLKKIREKKTVKT